MERSCIRFLGRLHDYGDPLAHALQMTSSLASHDRTKLGQIATLKTRLFRRTVYRWTLKSGKRSGIVAVASLAVVATAAALMNRRIDFDLFLICMVLAMLWLLYRSQRKNNQAIDAKLCELARRKGGITGANTKSEER